jgi:beta-xylosidase
MGLVRADGTPKAALRHFDSRMGICQWFHFEDHRLDSAVRWLRQLGVKRLRTGISWADWHRPGALAWFDRQMAALREFDVTLTLCFTPPSRGLRPCHTSPPQVVEEFAWFAAEVMQRYVVQPQSQPATGRPLPCPSSC